MMIVVRISVLTIGGERRGAPPGCPLAIQEPDAIKQRRALFSILYLVRPVPGYNLHWFDFPCRGGDDLQRAADDERSPLTCGSNTSVASIDACTQPL